ncbi:20226_t:CDS:2, partial [Funneliformis geosporum]
EDTSEEETELCPPPTKKRKDSTSTVNTTSTSISSQTTLTNYFNRPMSKYNVSDDEENQISHYNENEIDSTTNEHEISWNAIINEWIKATQKENQFDNNDDIIFLNDDWENDFKVGNREIHPADDQQAKWNLGSLFITDLEPPTYL